MQELLSGEVAKRLSVHPITVTRWAEDGKLPYRLNQHGWKLFQSEDVDRLAEERASKLETKLPG